MIHLFFALALLASPAEPSPSVIQYARHELRLIAVATENIDAREVPQMFRVPAEMTTDLRLIKKRIHDLNDAPFLVDALRFNIDRDICGECLAFNRAYRIHLQRMIELYPQDERWQIAQREADQLYRIWDWLRDAKCEFYYCHVRRAALRDLRNAIGDVAFNAGVMPMHVPSWRFVEVR